MRPGSVTSFPHPPRASRLFLGAAFSLCAAGCAELTLAWADLNPTGPEAAPPILAAFESDPPVEAPADWTGRRAPRLREALSSPVYGALPDGAATRILERRVLNESAFGGRGRLEEYRIAAEARFGDIAAELRDPSGEGFLMELVLPAGAAGPAPVILVETFCPRWETAPDPAVERPQDARRMGGVMESVATYVFGRHICRPPIEAILDAGFAIAVIQPSEFIPDRRAEGLEELRRLSAGHAQDETRWGAIAAWGWAYSRMIDALETDPRLDRTRFIAWGHSRYAKSALLAAAHDERLAGVIAHQSGTGGASLNRRKAGESVGGITANYPHWFAARYRAFAGRENELSIDQHMLLGLIAPRPVMLGNARRDVWSDPAGAFRAARGANPVYALFGRAGMTAQRLDDFRPGDDIAFWLRPGTHGVVKEDWAAFLEFLNAHFRPGEGA